MQQVNEFAAGQQMAQGARARRLGDAAEATCQALAQHFRLSRQHAQPLLAQIPIGIEIEVPWSSYFPTLWQEFGLDHRPFSSLSSRENEALSQRCREIERTLQPRLEATVACGVPKGADRYWEFAFAPVFDASQLLEQVALLGDAELLPRDRAHSLQATLGDLPPCPDLYYLMMLLEARHVAPSRLGMDRALDLTRQGQGLKGWARKGRSGIHLKTADDLAHGSVMASELRVLQLPTSEGEFRALMATITQAVNAICEQRAGLDTPLTRGWRSTIRIAREALASAGLPDRNWSAAAGAESIDRSSWERFLGSLPGIRERFDTHIAPGAAVAYA